MSSAIYPDPPRLVTAVCGHGEQQRLSNARLRLTFLLFPGYSLARARVGRFRISRPASREIRGEKMVWGPDRFNARGAHRLRGRPRFELIKTRDLESLATAFCTFFEHRFRERIPVGGS